MHVRTLVLTTACLLGGSALAPHSAMAHGDHPHPPGEPTEHTHGEAPPEAPLDREGAEAPGKAKTTPPAQPAAPAGDVAGTDPAPVPPANTMDEEGWRPRTLSDTTWRQAVRRQESRGASKYFDLDHFYFEMRFGPYSPQVEHITGQRCRVFELAPLRELRDAAKRGLSVVYRCIHPSITVVWPGTTT